MGGSGAWLQRLAVLEHGAAVLRRVGLGRVVDAVGSRVASSVRFELEVDGLHLSGDHLGHLYYLRELLGGREAYLVELLRDDARPGATVLDGGAHIGYLTLQAARAVGPAGRVIAVEPNPNTLAALRRNIDANPVGAPVTVVPVALGAAAGSGSLFVTPAGDTSSLQPPGIEAREVPVDVRTVDELVDGDPVDVVKLDLEGSEVEALRGMRRLIGRSRPTIFVECNPEALTAAGTSVDELLGELVAYDYDVRWIDERGRALRSVETAPRDDYVNLRCTPRRAREVDKTTSLFTDIVGSTELAASLGDGEWADLLERHHAAVRAQIARFDGQEMDTSGDGFFIIFTRPAQAIDAARAIIEAVRPLGLTIRVGIHTGDCHVADGKCTGLAIHIGARIVALAAPGEVLVSEAVKTTVEPGLQFADRGSHTLKGVPGEWHLFAVTS